MTFDFSALSCSLDSSLQDWQKLSISCNSFGSVEISAKSSTYNKPPTQIVVVAPGVVCPIWPMLLEIMLADGNLMRSWWIRSATKIPNNVKLCFACLLPELRKARIGKIPLSATDPSLKSSAREHAIHFQIACWTCNLHNCNFETCTLQNGHAIWKKVALWTCNIF